MANFYYVYILVSESHPGRYYTGLTEDLQGKVKAHNSGQLPYTAKSRPWIINTAIAFRSRKKASAFERYLKTHSGQAFTSKHF